MACDVLKSLIFLLLFICLSFCFYLVSCEDYQILYLEKSDVCPYHMKKKKVITLGAKEKSGLIFLNLNYLKEWSGKEAFRCSFLVHAPNQGLFAVIQDMYLRQNSVTNECTDYVQFKHSKPYEPESKKDEHNGGTKFCGQMKATEINTDDPNVHLAPNAYIDDKGAIEVEILVAPFKKFDNETLHFEIVFTTFISCKNDFGNHYKTCGSSMCIWHNYFNDSKVNCPFTDCKDAGTCIVNFNGTKITRFRGGLGSRVTMSAIASVFSVFLVFISCLWLCRHCGVFCFETPSHPTIHVSPVEMNDVHVSPSAPPLADDKDLPPSYDSLFPEER